MAQSGEKARALINKSDFSGGELSPVMANRVDSDKHANGMAYVNNMIPLITGGLAKRPGTVTRSITAGIDPVTNENFTRFIKNYSPTDDEAQSEILIPFVFNNEQSYVISIAKRVVFIPPVAGQSNPLSNTLSERFFMTIYFDGEELELDKGDPNDPNSVNVSEVFNSDETGLIFGSGIDSHRQTKWAQSGDFVYCANGEVPPYKIIRRGHTDWVVGVVEFNNAPETWNPANGYPRVVTFFENRLWFAATRREPQTLWASRTGDYEDFSRVIGKKDADNEGEVLDDSSLDYTVNSRNLNAIQWLSPGRRLIIGTTSDEFVMDSGDVSKPITPTSVVIAPQTTHGSNNVQGIRVESSVIFMQADSRVMREFTYNLESDGWIAPDLTLLAEHISREGISRLVYQQQPHRVIWCLTKKGNLLGLTYNRSNGVTGWHKHNIGGFISDIVVIPHWSDSRDVLFMKVLRKNEGEFLDNVPNPEVPGTQMPTSRTYSLLEFMTAQDYSGTGVYVDSCVEYSGKGAIIRTGGGKSPIRTFGNLSHLDGKKVAVIIDGILIGSGYTVDRGQIAVQELPVVDVEGQTLADFDNTKVVVGLPYKADMKTFPIDRATLIDGNHGNTSRIISFRVTTYQSGGSVLYNPSKTKQDNFSELGLPMPTSIYDNVHTFVSLLSPADKRPPLTTGTSAELINTAGFGAELDIAIANDTPLPFTLLGILILSEVTFL